MKRAASIQDWAKRATRFKRLSVEIQKNPPLYHANVLISLKTEHRRVSCELTHLLLCHSYLGWRRVIAIHLRQMRRHIKCSSRYVGV